MNIEYNRPSSSSGSQGNRSSRPSSGSFGGSGSSGNGSRPPRREGSGGGFGSFGGSGGNSRPPRRDGASFGGGARPERREGFGGGGSFGGGGGGYNSNSGPRSNNNFTREECDLVYTGQLIEKIEDGSLDITQLIDRESLVSLGLVNENSTRKVKLLRSKDKEITCVIKVKVDRYSAGAIESIESSGGQCLRIPSDRN